MVGYKRSQERDPVRHVVRSRIRVYRREAKLLDLIIIRISKSLKVVVHVAIKLEAYRIMCC